jgi:hypothetical protein
MITIEQGMKISAIIDKLDLKVPDPNKGQAFFGADLLMQVLAKAHRAKTEIYDLVAEVKGCTVKEAKAVNLMEFIKELGETEGIKDFLSSAVTSQAQE